MPAGLTDGTVEWSRITTRLPLVPERVAPEAALWATSDAVVIGDAGCKPALSLTAQLPYPSVKANAPARKQLEADRPGEPRPVIDSARARS